MSKKIKFLLVVGGITATATAGTVSASTAALAGASGTAGAVAISSEIATVGSIVDGGMVMGAIITTITAAAPVAVLGTVAYGLFKFFED